MDGLFLERLIQTIVFLLPVLALVWKGARTASKIETIEATLKERTDRFDRVIKEVKEKAEQERLATDSSFNSVMNTLNEIQKSIVRIEVQLKIDEVK